MPLTARRIAVTVSIVAALMLTALPTTAAPGKGGKPGKSTTTSTSTTSTSTTSTVPVAAVPARPVPTTFGIGVHAHADSKGIDGWMPRVAVPWDYAYRYIGGGLNTGPGKNWTEWAPDATFPIAYAKSAAARGYTPVLTYYTLLAANGACDATCGEAKRDLTNLNDPSVMRLYYEDFATLMKRLSTSTHDGITGFGGDVVVHVEPDLSGYANNAVLAPSSSCFGFCTGSGNSPALLKSSVGSSGAPELQGYPDTYQGFSLALARLRDLYAPNVRLAYHVSNWATRLDINTSTDPALDPTVLGTKAGVFAAKAGARYTFGEAPYDLVFNDVSNRDAGNYLATQGKDHWWDRLNVTFPNFHRWEAYVRAFSNETLRPTIVWQVPMGNQVYRTMDNSPGHYQDNRVEYFFAHLEELRDAGVAGLLFGSAHEGNTVYWDKSADLVTNPEPFCTSAGLSSGVICNNRETPYVDDDGGLLRVSAQQYYASPLPL